MIDVTILIGVWLGLCVVCSISVCVWCEAGTICKNVAKRTVQLLAAGIGIVIMALVASIFWFRGFAWLSRVFGF